MSPTYPIEQPLLQNPVIKLHVSLFKQWPLQRYLQFIPYIPFLQPTKRKKNLSNWMMLLAIFLFSDFVLQCISLQSGQMKTTFIMHFNYFCCIIVQGNLASNLHMLHLSSWQLSGHGISHLFSMILCLEQPFKVFNY